MARKLALTAAAVAAVALVSTGCSTAPVIGANGLGKVVYMPGLTGNPFYNTVACGAKIEAKKLGVDFSYQGSPNFGVADQTRVLNSVTATRPGAIMISITDPKAMIGSLTIAKRQGIKIIGIDGDLSNKSVMTTNIQADGKRAGELAGRGLAKAVGYSGAVLAVDNAPGSIVAEARTDGFRAAIAKYPKMRFLGIKYTNNDVSKATQIVSSTAGSNPSFVGAFGVETSNTQGALTGVREAGVSKRVKVVGFDTSDPIVAALRKGSLAGTVVQYPRGEGALGVRSAVAAMRKEAGPTPADLGRHLRDPEDRRHGQGQAVHLQRQLRSMITFS